MRRDVLEPWKVEVGILNCAYAVDSLHNPDTAAAMAAAVNDWLLAEWLDQEPRLRASMVVPTRVPEMAAEEIDRVGDHPGFVQVLLPVRSEAPYGHRRYLPIFEAAARHNLVVSLQFGGAPGNPPTGTGWPSYYIEEYVGMAQVFQTQVLNLVVEGVFDRFPNLRMALIESGWTWLPSLMWRIDKDWKGLRREVPWNTRVAVGVHPRADATVAAAAWTRRPIPRHLLQVDRAAGLRRAADVLDGLSALALRHDPRRPSPTGLPDGLRRKILRENARAFYRLLTTREDHRHGHHTAAATSLAAQPSWPSSTATSTRP